MSGGGRLLSSNRKGFTLAEVLVTLGIIGVVSAMTVPSLMQNYQKQSYITQLHKVYNELSQSLVRYQTDKNAVNLREAGLNNHDALSDFVKSTFKVVKECETMQNCFADEYKTLAGTSAKAYYSREYNSYILASGAALRPLYSPSGNKLINIAVDINGQKGPNITGRDFFFVYVYNNGYIDDSDSDAPLSTESREEMFSNGCQKGTTLYGCFGKILNDNWQMTY